MATWSEKVWEDGELITASKLNNIESGVEESLNALSEISKNNCVDVLSLLPVTSETKGGVEFEWSGDVCHVSASSHVSATVQNNFFKSLTSFPYGVQKGVRYKIFFRSEKVFCRVYEAVNGQQYATTLASTRTSPNGEISFAFSEEAEGCVISIAVNPSDTPLDETITKPRILNTLTNKELELRTDSLTNSVSGVNQKVDILYKLTQGQVWDAETDENDVLAYIREILVGRKAFALEKIGGRTIVMNQTIPKTRQSGSGYDLTFTNNDDGTWTINGVPNATNCFYNLNYLPGIYQFVNGHRYLLQKGTSDLRTIGIRTSGTNGGASGFNSENGDVIFTADTNNSVQSYARIQVSNLTGQTISNVTITPQCFDLTLMFGKTVADTITTPEQAYALGCPQWTPGDTGVQYNAGTLMSTAVESVAVCNILGQELDKMEIPAAVRTLPGYGWSAGTAYNSINYNAETDKWTYVQRVASVDLGTLTWHKFSEGHYADISNHKKASNSLTCARYFTDSSADSETYTSMDNGEIRCYMAGAESTEARYVAIRDDSFAMYSNAEVKAALNGVILYYELKTHVETDITDLMPPYKILDCTGGNMIRFSNENALPVRHRGTFFVKLSEVMQNG